MLKPLLYCYLTVNVGLGVRKEEPLGMRLRVHTITIFDPVFIEIHFFFLFVFFSPFDVFFLQFLGALTRSLCNFVLRAFFFISVYQNRTCCGWNSCKKPSSFRQISVKYVVLFCNINFVVSIFPTYTFTY